ncbi:unnamed protein product [Durusdinium trenchii]|uniref:STAS domain-containing protein n=1 Tax=Durusdinium trenchii TaxID=1381693 RepID=A0ABP0P057_9DINO
MKRPRGPGAFAMPKLPFSRLRPLALLALGVYLDLHPSFSQPRLELQLDRQPATRSTSEEWFSFGRTTLNGLQCCREWRCTTTRAQARGRCRPWASRSPSWTADITRQVPSQLISWESTSGMKNAGIASFRPLQRVEGQAACEVEVQMSIRAPSFLRRLFQSRRLSSLAASAIGKDLAGFRRVVLTRAAASAMAGLRTAVTNSTYKDNLGSCQVLVEHDGHIEMTLFGFGTSDSTRKLLDDCAQAMGQFEEGRRFTAVVDMTRGIGCSPLAVPTIVSFLQHHGSNISRTAVLGPRPLMALAQMISKVARQAGVAFFTDRSEANRWCAEEDA